MRNGIMSILSSCLPPARAHADPRRPAASLRNFGPQARPLLDETTLLRDDEITCLAARGTIFLTRRDDGRFGAIIAETLDLAMTRADIRNGRETVIGLMDAGFVPHLRASAKNIASYNDTVRPGASAPRHSLF